MRIATTNATTDPSTRHLPTNGTRERSDVCSAMAVAVAVGARNLPLLVAVELERRSTSVDLASSSFLDGIFRLRGPLPSMLSVVRGVVHAVGKQASMHCSRTGTIGSVRQTQATKVQFRLRPLSRKGGGGIFGTDKITALFG